MSLEFVKIEHTLFSLPFVLIGYLIVADQFNNLLNMTRCASCWRQYARGWRWPSIPSSTGTSMRPILARSGPPSRFREHEPQDAFDPVGCVPLRRPISASLLNPVALMMAWLPVLAFVIYPYMARSTWLCHLWLASALALAPAGAWVAIAADVHGWAAITGMLLTRTEFPWAPTILPVSLGGL